MHLFHDHNDNHMWTLVEYHDDGKGGVNRAELARCPALFGASWTPTKFLCANLSNGTIWMCPWNRTAYEVKIARGISNSCEVVISKFSSQCCQLTKDIREMKEKELKQLESRVTSAEETTQEVFESVK